MSEQQQKIFSRAELENQVQKDMGDLGVSTGEPGRPMIIGPDGRAIEYPANPNEKRVMTSADLDFENLASQLLASNRKAEDDQSK